TRMESKKMIARNLLFEVLSLATQDAVRDGVAKNCAGAPNPVRPDLLDRRHVHRGVTAVVGAVGGAGAGRIPANKRPAGLTARTSDAAHGDGAYAPFRRQLLN